MKVISNIKQINEAGENQEIQVNPNDVSETVIKFKPIIIAALSIVKIFTGSEADKKIDELIAYLETL